MLGSMVPWQQLVIFGLSLLAFITVFFPLDDDDHTPWRNFKRLLTFPVFWLGLLFLGYIAIMGLNPWLEVRDKGITENFYWYHTQWWLSPVKHIDWLPSGVIAPFEFGNSWKAFVQWGAPILAVWTAWAGLRYRRSIICLFWVICLNGACLALIGLLMKLTRTDKLLWHFTSGNIAFFGPFHYSNHGAAYLYPILALCLGMFFYYMHRARRRMQKSSPSLFFLILAAMIAVAMVLSLSRGGIILSAGILAGFVILYLLSLVATKSVKGVFAGIATLLLVAGIGVAVAMQFANVERLKQDFAVLKDDRAVANDAIALRLLLMEATLEMYLDRPVYGWGAGSYPWTFRKYQHMFKYKQLLNPFPAQWRKAAVRHAHCDWLQFPAELGSVGAGLLLSMLLFWLGAALYFFRAIGVEHIMIACGPAMSLVHALFDFNLSNPAVLIVFSMLVSLTVCWLRLNPRYQSAVRK